MPTFSSFLRDVESPSDVKEYVKTYLGDNREANEFAKNFLERRSRMRAASRAAQYEDDMCAPAAAINPGAGQDSQDSSKKGDLLFPTTSSTKTSIFFRKKGEEK